MLLNLTDLSDEPLQAQIVRQLRAKILAGVIQADEGLPSIRAMARDQHISVITVQRAYETLERAGLIHSRRGKGFFVSDLPADRKKDMAVERLANGLQPRIKEALAEGLTARDVTHVVERMLRDGAGETNEEND